MDISVQVVWSFALALFLTLVLPILLLLFLCLFKKISPLPMALGLLSFFISQILLRIPLLQFCAGQGWYQALAQSSPLVLGLGLAFTAGLFEESARLGGAALLGPRKPAFPGGPPRPGHRTWKGALSFGLGHAFCELILLAGMTHVNNLLFCVLLGMGEETLSGLLPAGQLDTLTAQFAAVTPLGIAAGLDVVIGGGQLLHLGGHPVHPSPLLVHRQEQGHIVPVESLQAVGQLGELSGALHIAAKEDHAPHLVVGHRLGAVVTGLGPVNTRHQQLAHLLLHRHACQPLRDGVGGGGGLRRGGGRGS